MATSQTIDRPVLKRTFQIALLLGSMLSALASSVECCAEPKTDCLYWAEVAAIEAKIPPALMKAIATIESGRNSSGKLTPWPWTLNVQGKGIWFTKREEAQARIAALAASGTRNIDIGCFQLNLRWHGNHFASISSMLEPSSNARYAAYFLQGLYRELGSWDAAATAFHSRTPEYAKRYREKLEPVLRQYGGSLPSEDISARAAALQKSPTSVQEPSPSHETHRALASLVPSNFQNPARPLFGLTQ